MPLKKGAKNVGKNIAELHGGPQYSKTKAKHGKGVANKQAVAVAIKASGKGRGDPMIGQKAKKAARQTKLGQALMEKM